MEALIPIVVLVLVGLLALRFGADSRPTIHSAEHRLAATGMVWEAETHPTGPTVDTAAMSLASDQSPVRVLVRSAPSRNQPSAYPTLHALDGARGPGHRAFATDPDAAALEDRARLPIDRHWSEHVWLTGLIDQARLDLVCTVLEHDRQARQHTARQVDGIVIPDPQSSIAS